MSDIFLTVGKIKHETMNECFFYDWGGCISRDYVTYPTAYGSRCESYNEFFTIKEGELFPNCPNCKRFITWSLDKLSSNLMINLPTWIETEEEMFELMKAFDNCRNEFSDIKKSLWKQFSSIEKYEVNK